MIVSKGNTDAAYIWEKGTEMPTTPTLQITTASKTTGDMYYYSYQDTAYIDDIKILHKSNLPEIPEEPVIPEFDMTGWDILLDEDFETMQNIINQYVDKPLPL